MKAKLLLTAGAIALLATGCNFKTEGSWQKDKGGEHAMCMVLESKVIPDPQDGAKKAIIGKCQFYSNGKVTEFIQRPAIVPDNGFNVGTTILMSVEK